MLRMLVNGKWETKPQIGRFRCLGSGGISSGNDREMVRDKEAQLLFVLDFLLHFTFDDHDTANTV